MQLRVALFHMVPNFVASNAVRVRQAAMHRRVPGRVSLIPAVIAQAIADSAPVDSGFIVVRWLQSADVLSTSSGMERAAFLSVDHANR